MKRAGVVIVGTSIAATTAASTLRIEGYDGAITMLGQESHQPYARPPLSKAVLAGIDAPESAALSMAGAQVTVRTRARAVRLDPEHRHVVLADGEVVSYQRLIIATGARARCLTSNNDPTEHVLRSMDDAHRLVAALADRPSVLIVGGGVLAFELASSCRIRGLDVTIVDRSRPLVTQLGSFLADTVVENARAAGVRVLVSPSGIRRHAEAGHTVVETGDGTRLTADLVVTCVGCRPNIEWLEGSGLPVDEGVIVDQWCRVAADIVAAGDVCRVRSTCSPAARRTANWTDAINQAGTAARTLMHGDGAEPYLRDPYFWTEGHGLSVKVAGRIPHDGVPLVLATNDETDGRLFQWLEGGQPVAAAALNYRIPIAKLKRLSRVAAP